MGSGWPDRKYRRAGFGPRAIVSPTLM